MREINYSNTYRIEYSWEEWVNYHENHEETASKFLAHHDNGWLGGASNDTAKDYLDKLAAGWGGGKDRVKALTLKAINRFPRKAIDYRNYYDVCGDDIDIAKMVEGSPEHMIFMSPQAVSNNSSRECLIIAFNATISATIPTEVAFTRGASVLALAMALESIRMPVKIILGYGGWCGPYKRHKFGVFDHCEIVITLKDFWQPIDWSTLCYALVHPSAFRLFAHSWHSDAIGETDGMGWNPRNMQSIGILDPKQEGHILTIDCGIYGKEEWTSPEKAEQWILSQIDKLGVKAKFNLGGQE